MRARSFPGFAALALILGFVPALRADDGDGDWSQTVRPALPAALSADSDLATTAMVSLARGAREGDHAGLHDDAVTLLERVRDPNQAFVLQARPGSLRGNRASSARWPRRRRSSC